MKMARCIEMLEKIYGIRNGGNRGNQYKKAESDNLTLVKKTQVELAEQMGLSKQQLSDYKKLNKLIPELQDLVENDKLKSTTAYKIASDKL